MTVNSSHCNQAYITNGTIGIMTILMSILTRDAFRMAGEAKTMELFIKVTSPDRLDDPRRGSELWDHLKTAFPAEAGGVDGAKIAQVMAQKFMAMW